MFFSFVLIIVNIIFNVGLLLATPLPQIQDIESKTWHLYFVSLLYCLFFGKLYIKAWFLCDQYDRPTHVQPGDPEKTFGAQKSPSQMNIKLHSFIYRTSVSCPDLVIRGNNDFLEKIWNFSLFIFEAYNCV